MITHERLLEVLHYDPETGVFTWKIDTRGCRHAIGDRAGYFMPAYGRRSARWGWKFEGNFYGLNRLAWFYMTGAWPIFEIDHANTNSLDDSWANLRQSTRQQNEINKARYRNNKSGFKGVWPAKGGKFYAAIHRNYQRKFLGSFATAEEAASAYAVAAKAFDGQFLRTA